MLATASACAEEPETETAAPTRTQQPLASAAADAAPQADSPSQQALAVFWQTKSAASASGLSARVQNGTDATQSVTLRVVGTDPYGRSVTRSLGKRSLAPKAGLDFDVKIADLPVQSAGLASQVAVLASHEIELQVPGGVSKKLTREVHSGVVYVTFTDDFARAAVRSVGEQATQNGLESRAGLKKALKLRHFNANANRVDEQSTAPSALVGATDGMPLPLISVTDVALGPLPSAN